MTREAREWRILLACWGKWRKPVDVAMELGEERRTVAKHMQSLNRDGMMLRRGDGDIRYRTSAPTRG